MAKRRNLLEKEAEAPPLAPPQAQPKLAPSPLMRSRLGMVADHMVQEVTPVSNRESYKSAGFAYIKLFFGAVSVIIDFWTNHQFLSPNSITVFSIAFALFLMVSEFMMLYAFYAWRDASKEQRPAEATKYLAFFLACVSLTIVDFVATVVPVHNFLMDVGSNELVAYIMGIGLAVFTTVMQVDFYPDLLGLVKSLFIRK